jgi:PAS domain S-box-containing protein
MAAISVTLLDRFGVGAEHRAAEQEREWLTEIVDRAVYAIVAKSLDGIIRRWNRAAERLFGYEAEEIVGQPITVLFPPERIDEENFILDRIKRGQCIEEFETHRRRKDGNDIHVALNVSPIFSRAGTVIGASKIVRNITERRRAEAALRASETRFAAIFNQAVVGVGLVDAGARIVMANGRLCTILGRSEQDLLGLQWQMLTHPDDLPTILVPFGKLLTEGQSYVIDKRCLRPDGSSIWVDVAASVIDDPATGERQMIGVVQDITSRKEAEIALRHLNETLEQRVEERTRDRERLEEQLRQAQKMETVGRLTGGIAHDFNNILTIVSGNLELLDSAVVRENARASELVATARRAIDRAERLIGQLLTFSRRQTLRPETVNINGLLADFADLVARAAGDAVRLCLRYDSELWLCHVDPAQFQSAILNLAVNACDAMPSGGHLTIETSNFELDLAGAARLPDITPGGYIAISVADTGTGIAPELLERIFEPFFTTKRPGKGTGLGLSQVYGFVRQSGGTVAVDSEIGHGTRFRIFLPKAVGAVIPASGPQPVELPRGSETILVAEDDESLLDLVITWITALGYRGLRAGNGQDALHLLRHSVGERIDLLMTDLSMPGGRGGLELASAARKLRPEIRILLTTGSASCSSFAAAAEAGGFPILRKPYRRSDLAQTVRATLDDA